MAYSVDVKLTDAAGKDAEGGGSWQIVFLKNGAPMHDTGALNYTGAALKVTVPIAPDWTHATVRIAPGLYALQGVKVNRSSTGLYRNNASARLSEPTADLLKIELPVLRIREAPGIFPSSDPHPKDDLRAVWLRRVTVPGSSKTVYRELRVNEWLKKRTVSTIKDVADRSGFKSPIAYPDADPGDPWLRFNGKITASDPESAGAPLLFEYGEVGSMPGQGAIFLVGIWAPNRSQSPGSGALPAWRDFATFLHPSTAKPVFPISPFPFAKGYPYPVGENPDVPTDNPGRIFQPYVNLAMKHVLGIWSQFYEAGRETVFISPILPHPIEKHPDDLEYGLPFRTRSGLARLFAEVNLYLHQIRYGWSGTNLDAWSGGEAPTSATRSPADGIHLFVDERTAPPVRKVAVAAFSASSTQLDALFSTSDLSHQRYRATRWGVAGTTPLQAEWLESWAIDLKFGSATVAAASFEQKLLDWFGRNEKRRFLITNSGTTGGSDARKLYPKLRALAAATQHYSSTDAAKFAEVWRGANDGWIGLFCSNPYLSDPSAPNVPWPPFEKTADPDLIHAFMYALSLSLASQWSELGRP